MAKNGSPNQAQLFRDEALDQVSRNSNVFQNHAYDALRSLPEGLYTGEDIRVYIEKLGIYPHHHNAWGAFINHAVRSKILYRTGQYRQMREPKSHARATPVYRKF